MSFFPLPYTAHFLFFSFSGEATDSFFFFFFLFGGTGVWTQDLQNKYSTALVTFPVLMLWLLEMGTFSKTISPGCPWTMILGI
jgi:hypothetical protein